MIDKIDLVINEIVVGTITYDHESNALCNFEVIPLYRKLGVGNALLDVAIKEFAPKYISVDKDNEVACRMYQKRGFVIVDDFINAVSGKECWYMERNSEALDRCVCCGTVIPEGQQVCWICEHKEFEEKEKEQPLRVAPTQDKRCSNV